MPNPYLAPSLARLREEVNTRWPKRDKAADGWIGDAAHAARTSQHNPDGKGCVHAIDVDTDGIDSNWLVQRAIKHAACWYVIYNRVIWSDTDNWVPKPYTGADPHTGHVHISIHLTGQAELSAALWLGSPATPTTTKRDQESIDMADLTPKQRQDLIEDIRDAILGAEIGKGENRLTIAQAIGKAATS